LLRLGFGLDHKTGHPADFRLAFTVAPHLQPINYRGCFSPFVGI
jgi:hypothetical protein